METKKIVIVGSGFAGLHVALGLAKKFKYDKSVSLTLIDKNDYHLFSPNLYKAAAAEEELVSISQLKKSIALPFKEILAHRQINFIKGELKAIKPQVKKITIGIKEFEYDYLILATGSNADVLQISGAKTYSLLLNSLPDALRIRNAIEFAVQVHCLDITKKALKFVIAGGNNIAVGLAGELSLLLDFISWKNNYPREKLEIVVLETSNQLFSSDSIRLNHDALLKLNELRVQVKLNFKIANISQHLIEFTNGEKMEYSALVWTQTAGMTSLPAWLGLSEDQKNGLETNEFLQIKKYHNISVIGGLFDVLNNQNNQDISTTYQNAVCQGKYLAYALPLILNNKRPMPYLHPPKSLCINIGRHWAIIKSRHLYLKGFLAYLISLLSHFIYFRRLVGFKKAFRYIFREAKLP